MKPVTDLKSKHLFTFSNVDILSYYLTLYLDSS